MDSTHSFDGPEGTGFSSPYPYGGYVGARRDERSASRRSAAFQGFSPSPNRDSNASSAMYASEAGIVSNLSAHSFLPPPLHSSASALDPSNVGGQNTSNNGGGDFSFYSTNILNTPGTFPWAQRMPDGYEQIIPSRGNVFDQWARGLTLDARYNFYYQRKVEPVHLKCPLCAQDILGCNIRQHLKENHRGYCQKDSQKVKCFACGPSARLMNAKSYPDHVRERHCHLSVLCPYCGEEFTRGESVTRHCISVCKRLIPYRRQ
ncbi:hypothetical protein EDD85DRAFT_849004 [Armillaria nabsnona]|nr:hypothetical protein EDD85DRAFT_849004 [Armillaria nabsnona]